MTIEFTKIKHDVNGNPRYVCHYHALLTEQELQASAYDYQGRVITPTKYQVAVKRANKIGGRKYHNKSYGGGIVFTEYSLPSLERRIKELLQDGK